MFILLLPLQELVKLYMNFFSAAALSLSVFSIYHFVKDEIKIRNENPFERTLGFNFLKRHVGIRCHRTSNTITLFPADQRCQLHNFYQGDQLVSGLRPSSVQTSLSSAVLGSCHHLSPRCPASSNGRPDSCRPWHDGAVRLSVPGPVSPRLSQVPAGDCHTLPPA